MDGLLLVARALDAQQAALNVTGENLSNANTVGYSAQSVAPVVEPIVGTAAGPPGSVDANGIGDSYITSDPVQRASDQLLNEAVWGATSDTQAATTSQGIFQQASSVLSELGGTGLGADVSSLFSAVQQAAQTPSDLSLRSSVLASASTVATDFNTQATQLQNLSTETSGEAQAAVTTVNSILSELAQINQAAPGPATVQSDAVLDQQGVLVSSLSQFMSVQATVQPNGSLTVYQGGTPLVFGQTARSLTLQTDSSGQTSLVTDAGRTLSGNVGGSLGGQIDALNNGLPALQGSLNQAASAFMSNVNGILANSSDLKGQPGAPLFTGTGAADMAVSITDPSQLAFAASSLQSTASVAAAGATVADGQSLTSQSANFAAAPQASGVVAVNGVNIAWNSSQSLDTILSNFQAAGVTATFDSSQQQIALVRNPSSNAGTPGPGVTIADVSGNFTAFTNLSGATLDNGVPGDATGANAIANLATATVVGGQTLQGAIDAVGTQAANQASQFTEETTSNQSLQNALTQQQQGISGVNSDNQMLAMVQYQRAYEAALKLASAQDEMLNQLINQTMTSA